MSKVWLVTGSANGLGRNIAEAILESGAHGVADHDGNARCAERTARAVVDRLVVDRELERVAQNRRFLQVELERERVLRFERDPRAGHDRTNARELRIRC